MTTNDKDAVQLTGWTIIDTGHFTGDVTAAFRKGGKIHAYMTQSGKWHFDQSGIVRGETLPLPNSTKSV